ncbi:thioredoxin family protein [Phycicoccus sp. CSK15P-2]|uniref:thioredoxin family protein n=1 Tax=Phycicoccus sp. CSK15P-2 TaxID=2807627 RepID=UPI0019520EDF|nr:thioredoxin family protein [Phycicoccus sp. CSK15P-2]MBM6403004.1 thioredoxin family protein [Phycicoccus sp. CSK15P-2]
MRIRPAVLAATAVAGLTLAACGTETPDADAGAGSGATTSSSASSTAGSTSGTDASGDAAAAGSYVSLADYDADPSAYEDTKVVLFFHADWCPSCRATEAAIAEKGVPAGLTVVEVDYDSETDLRKQYGITQQHTFVQVDGSGAELGKWSGSADGAAILAETV